jgi:GT2 family glycosyltransferase
VQNELITSKSPHHQALETLAANALAAKDFSAAFQYADRRCRSEPAALAHCYVLRAEAAYNIGDVNTALSDLKTAIEISPHDVAAARRQFAWGDDADRYSAALTLIAHDQDVGNCRAAVRALGQSGQRRLASVSVFDRYVIGWAAWDQDEEAELAIRSEDGVISSLLAPDPFHPLSSVDTYAAAFRVARPASPVPQIVSIALSGKTFFSRRMPPNARQKAVVSKPTSAHLSELPPTVILPVFADFDATRACLDSLLADSQRNYRILIVDDDSPETAIKHHLASLAKSAEVTILSNPINLGFVGSVNRALAWLDGGDVVLLNADTIVPAGFVDRLRATAALSGDIGTVVPLSNNGEITDFPKPNGGNPLGSRDDVMRIDRIAARSDKTAAVDIPNGTGFCLYITRACLNAVGRLSENFQRGYLEDIDLCLRARERGFRNVCAPSVYVGHAGSRSFRSEKRSLVLHNLDILDHRFPHFRNECAAFVASDPLRSCRENIERQLTTPVNTTKPPVLVLGGIGALRALTARRVDQLMAEGHFAIVLEMVSDNEGKRIRLTAAEGNVPQSLSFELWTNAELGEWRAYLKKLRPSHCEMIGIAVVTPELTQTFAEMNIPLDFWVADGTSIATRLGPELPIEPQPRWDGRAFDSYASDERHVHNMISTARRILVPNATAKLFTTQLLPGREIHVLEQPAHAVLLPEPSRQRAQQLAVVSTRSSANEFRIIRLLALRLRSRQPAVSIFVAGSTFDDVRLMSHDNVFVSGPVEVSELGRVLQPHNVGWILTGFDGPLFGHPLIEAARGANIPVAYLDWSRGADARRAGDLTIDPDLLNDQLVDQVAAWIEGTDGG